MPVEKTEPEPFFVRAERYRRDLDKLDSFYSLISAKMINEQDLKVLEVMCKKYSLEVDEITLDNFHIVLGGLQAIVMQELRNYTDDLMERHREKTPGKVPRKITTKSEPIPKSLEE